MDLEGARILVKVIQSGSFSAAGRALRIPKSTVSSKVSHLEADLGVTLVRRTTRKLSLTREGEIFLEEASGALSRLEDLDTRMRNFAQDSADAKLRGPIRLTAPIDLGSHILPDLLSRFLKLHPEVEIDLVLTDRVMDLVGEGVDLAIRAGLLQDSSLRARKIGVAEFQVFGSLRLIRDLNLQKLTRESAEPQAFQSLPFIGFSPILSQADSSLRLRSGHRQFRAEVTVRSQCNNLQAVRAFILNGSGLGLIPKFLVMDDLERGHLQTLCPAWKTEAEPFYLLRVSSSFPSKRVVALTEFLSKEIKVVF